MNEIPRWILKEMLPSHNKKEHSKTWMDDVAASRKGWMRWVIDRENWRWIVERTVEPEKKILIPYKLVYNLFITASDRSKCLIKIWIQNFLSSLEQRFIVKCNNELLCS